jgi:hypothetical protein
MRIEYDCTDVSGSVTIQICAVVWIAGIRIRFHPDTVVLIHQAHAPSVSSTVFIHRILSFLKGFRTQIIMAMIRF